MIPYTVTIRETATGKEVKYKDNWTPWEDDPTGEGGLSFMYGEGNYSCDCNRKLFFGYAQDIKFSDEETPCGNTRYFVTVVIDDTGLVVYSDLEGK